jgi:hypothetical protein
MTTPTEILVRVTTTRLDSVDAVRAQLGTVAAWDGWVQYASSCVAQRAGADTVGVAKGVPLAAEFADGTRSAALRREGDGWIWVEIVAGDGDTRCRRESASFASTEGGWRMEYEVYWRQNPTTDTVHPWTPWVARFVGWKLQEVS